MWSYYGRKKKIVKRYPVPKYDMIIEPFAGSASYAYEYFEKDVILIDAFSTVIKIWKYLQNTTPQQILKLPDIAPMECIDGKYLQLCEEERMLIGYCINNGSTIPKKTARHGGFNSWNHDKIRIAKDLYKIKHWKFILGDYHCIDNLNATWFIDPPYQYNKYAYGFSTKPNFVELAEWNKSRNGQVIVCDNTSADYMDFKPLVELKGQKTTTMESMWYKND